MQASDVSNRAMRDDVDDISNDVSEKVEAREGCVTRSGGVWGPRERKSKCAAARGVHEPGNRTFERRVGARAGSDGVEGSMSV